MLEDGAGLVDGEALEDDAAARDLGAEAAQQRGHAAGRLRELVLGLERVRVLPPELQVAQGVGRAARGAVALGLVTFAPDDIDWDDEIRIAFEERASLSPDALTGMEANLRFGGPETMETKIFARLSAWQNWIFQRPNAVGEKGALTLYGKPERAEFSFLRT